MLKGHLQIELRNEKTGQVERHEQDNMVTSAVAKLLGLVTNGGALYSSNNLAYSLLPIAQKALGGIYLFDGKLEESKDNIHFPMDVHLTGCAGRETDTASLLKGSLNVAETMALDNGYTSVWDFSTSQANGTISSLALTNYYNAESPFERMRYGISSFSIGSNYKPIAYDVDKGIVYYLISSVIYSQKVCTNIIQANSPYYGSVEKVFDFSFKNPSSYSSWTVCNGYDGYLYAIYYPVQSSIGIATIKIRKIKISDFSFTEEDELTFSVADVLLAGSSYKNTFFDATCAVSHGYLYVLKKDFKELYKINLSNTVDIETFAFDKYTPYYICPMFNGGLYVQFKWNAVNASGASENRYAPGIIYPDGEYRCITEKYGTKETYNVSYMTTEADNLMTGYPGSGTSSEVLCYMRNYLGTICNLSSPVTKTPEQTMKITYTLTDV